MKDRLILTTAVWFLIESCRHMDGCNRWSMSVWMKVTWLDCRYSRPPQLVAAMHIPVPKIPSWHTCTNHDLDYEPQLRTANNTINGLEDSRTLVDHCFLKQKVATVVAQRGPMGKRQFTGHRFTWQTVLVLYIIWIACYCVFVTLHNGHTHSPNGGHLQYNKQLWL